MSESEKTKLVVSMSRMMKSIFTYGTLEKNNYYLRDYLTKLSQKTFDNTFENQKKYLEENFKVEYDTYTDREGCTYNSLVPIN
jgi:hypothetical protein